MTPVTRLLLFLSLAIFTSSMIPQTLAAFDEPMVSIETGNVGGVGIDLTGASVVIHYDRGRGIRVQETEGIASVFDPLGIEYDIQETTLDQAEIITRMSDYLLANRDRIDAMIGLGDLVTGSVARVWDQVGVPPGEIPVVGWGNSPETAQEILDGYVLAGMWQDPQLTSYTGLSLAAAMAAGFPVGFDVLVGVVPFDAMNRAGRYYLQRMRKSTGIPARDLVTTAVQGMGLRDVEALESLAERHQMRLEAREAMQAEPLAERAREIQFDRFAEPSNALQSPRRSTSSGRSRQEAGSCARSAGSWRRTPRCSRW